MSVISLPWKTIEPADGASVPASRLKRVVLPAPLGPMIPRISPSATSNDTSRVTCSAPNDFDSPRTDSRVAIRLFLMPARGARGQVHHPEESLAQDAPGILETVDGVEVVQPGLGEELALIAAHLPMM